MTRRLLNLLAILSVLLFAGVTVLGVWGYREGPREVRLEWVGKHHCLALLSDRGALAAVYSSGWPAGDWVNDRPLTVTGTPTPLNFRNALLFELTEERVTMSDGRTTATVRYQGIMTNFLYASVFTAALPAWRLLRRFAARTGPELCRICGYDLRATPDRCPECGAAGTQLCGRA
jgi:hypothetical protein